MLRVVKTIFYSESRRTKPMNEIVKVTRLCTNRAPRPRLRTWRQSGQWILMSSIRVIELTENLRPWLCNVTSNKGCLRRCHNTCCVRQRVTISTFCAAMHWRPYLFLFPFSLKPVEVWSGVHELCQWGTGYFKLTREIADNGHFRPLWREKND